MAFADGNIIIGTRVDVGGLNTGLAKIEKSFKRLGKLAAFAIGAKAIVGLGKAALDAASDLQEIQNVVDVSFTKLDEAGNVVSDMTWKIEAFAKTCIEKFGMSELAAKQTAGSFMAMGKSMGLTMEEASDMAVSLTALTGDFSSFYNISQDYARVALSAVYTGETETLKRYGIVLTEANLQQYALSQGIETTVKKMDARDKAILRYMYIMDATRDMEGDFVRTQDSWANSTRVLQQVWNQFLITLGNGLITVLTPLVRVLNVIIQRLTVFTKQLWQIIANIFGLQLQDLSKQAGGAASGFGDLADNAEDAGDAVAKSAKKMQKHLATFDELNNIVTTSDSGNGSGKGAGLGLGDIDLGLDGIEDQLAEPENWIDIDTLRGLGKWIGDKLCDMMESIDWDAVYERARGFGKGLADFLNGLFVDTNLFKDLGHTIAGSLNTVMYAALSFAETFEWGNVGTKIAAGINEFFRTFDFGSLAQTINKWVQGLFSLIYETITNINWGLVFKGIYDFFTGLDASTVAILFGFFALKKLIKIALAENLVKAFSEGVMQGLGMNPGAKLFAPYISSWGFTIATKILSLKTTIVSAFQRLFASIPAALSSLKLSFDTFGGLLGAGNGLQKSMQLAFGGVATTIAGISTVLGGLTIAIKSFFDMWNSGWSIAKTVLEGVGLALAAIGAVILGLSAPVAAAIAGIVFAVSQVALYIKAHWDEVKTILSTVGTWIMDNVITPVSEFFSGLFLRIGQFAEGCWILIKAIWIVVSGWFQSNVITPLVNFFSPIVSFIAGFFTRLWNNIQSIWSTVSTWFSNVVINPIVNAFRSIINTVSSIFTTVGNAVKNVIRGIVNGVIGLVEGAINRVINTINSFIRGFNNVVSLAARITGSDWGGVSLLSNVSIPRLASGAVIPPNKEFLAVLGDQKSGTNIEAPLDTIKQAFMETLSGLNLGSGDQGDIIVQIDGYEVFRAVRKQNDLFTKSTGISAF